MNHGATKHPKINGSVASGFEPIEKMFHQHMRTMAEKNTQLCIYHRGEKVVDLWASATGDDSFSADSLINVFSSGKSLEAIAIASLVSKGLLSYDAKITQYWPEFGASGKEGLTIADLMRHEAGLANFDTSLDMEDLFTENIKQNIVGRIIEGHAQTYAEGGSSKREYHAITRGWIVNEVFRRVDPSGRTIGEFLREDLSSPLEADVVIGVKEQEMKRVSRVSALSFGYQLLQSLKPRFLGRGIVHNIFQILGRLIRLVPAIIKARKVGAPPPFTGMDSLGFFNEPHFAMGETPSANATCSARGLAKIAAMMSAGGKWEGTEYLSEQAWSAMHENPLHAAMGGLLTTRFTQGGVDCFTECTPESTRAERAFNEGREGFYGWMGLGGSIFQWHPRLDIGFAFVPTSLHVLDLLNERGKAFQAETLNCVAGIIERQSADGQDQGRNLETDQNGD
jgi:CubicO group peptidase (beta-lactamase class C family)